MECTGKHAKSVGANIRRSQEAAFKDVFIEFKCLTFLIVC